MTPAQPTPDEAHRIETLRSYAVLDTLPEQALDDLVGLAAQICGAPIAMISLIDEKRQWFKSRIGMEMPETPRDISFCGHAVHQRDLFIVADAMRDERFADNPLVTGEPGIRFYAGAPLVSPEDTVLGALCVIDRLPRALTEAQTQALRVLARQVMTHLELRRYTRELIESEERLRVVTDNARVGLVIVNRDRRYIYANEAYAVLLGLPSSAIVGRRVPDVLAEIYEGQIKPRLDRAFAGERVAYELRHPADGDECFEVRYEPKIVNGEVPLVVVVITDITQRKAAEIASRRLAAIVESSDDAIISKTLDGIITSWNLAAERMFGYQAEEIIGQSITVLFPPDRMQEEDEILAHIVRGEPVQHFETIRVRKDGRQLEVSATISPIKDDEGKITGVSKIVRDITERRQVEAALRKSEAKFRVLVEQAVDAFFLHDHEGKFLEVNRRACESLGYSREELLQMSVADLSSLDDQAAKRIWAQLQAGSTLTVEDNHRRRDGTRFPVEIRLGSLDVDGQRIFLGLARDITERKQAEEQLRWKTAFFEAQVNAALDGILIVDSDGKTVLQNQRMIELWNFPAEIADHADDRLRLEWVAHQVRNSQQFREKVVYLYAHPEEISRDELALVDGRIFDRYSAPVLGRQGKYYGRIWSFRDITERKQAEEQIAEQAALLDKTRDAILVRDLEGKVLFWNQGAERMYGWTRQEVVGRHTSTMIYADPKKFNEVNGLAVSQGEWHGELQHLTKNRGEITIEARWTLIRDNEGRPKSVLAINTDVTERKKIEAQFMRAQRMESIGRLAGGVAHDLNNILAPIMMSIELLKVLSDKPLATQMLETIEVSAKRGADIVRQVLSFARGLDGERIEVQPKHLLKDLENITKNTFPKDIQLRFLISDGTWTILGDPTQIHQILLNLCVNARDAMPNGGSLAVSVENCILDEQYAAMNIQTKPGRYVMIGVTDSGMGIAPGIIDKIFEPFFTTKEQSKGTGLGLSTVMAIVKSHDGLINVYSEPGKGTTFKVYLPAMEASSGTQKEQNEKVSLPRGNGETILIVDDEASILAITSQTLQAFGYRVLTATNGADAVAVYVQNKNDIAAVLTDVMMPVMDGLATIHALMRINPAVRLMAASGLNMNMGTAKAANAGIKHFLTKPYTAETLLKTVRAMLDEDQAAGMPG